MLSDLAFYHWVIIAPTRGSNPYIQPAFVPAA